MATDKQHTTLNVPTLRFPEFTGEWNIVNVSDLLEFYSTNSLSWEQLDYNDGDIKNLHYGLIHVGLPTNVDLSKDELPYIKSEYIPKNFTICKDGDIAFADASEDTNEVAKVIEFVNVDNQNVVCGLHTIHGRDKLDATIIGFKGYAFSSIPFHHQIRKIAQGTKIYSISTKNFSECTIGVPSKAEQQKIADLMAKIDARIATQKKVIERLETLINGLAVRLTSGGAANIALCDCAECKSSTLQESQLLDVGLHPVYGATGIVGYTNTADVNGNGVLIIKDGSGVGAVRYVDKPFSFTGTLNCLTAKVGYNIRYIYYCLKAFNFTPYKTGLAIPHIYFKDYSKAKIYCPSIEEQNKVVSTLSSIEEKRQIEIAILDSITYEKLYMLSNMFI
jgi:type I restriction enzyme S subunit